MSGKRKSTTILDYFKNKIPKIEANQNQSSSSPVNICHIVGSDKTININSDMNERTSEDFHITDLVTVPLLINHLNLEMPSGNCTQGDQSSIASKDYAPQNINISNTLLDIYWYKNKAELKDNDKIQILQNLPIPSNNFDFPKTQHGKKLRKFRPDWLDLFKWLIYSKVENGVYCKFCFIFAAKEVGKTSSQQTGQLVSTCYKNWPHALENFQKHQQLGYHKIACVKADNFLDVTVSKKIEPIKNQIDITRMKQIQENRERLIPIINTVVFCGRQCLALRGHKDYGPLDLSSEPEENEGNFRALLRMRIESGDINLKKHFDINTRNASYISWNIQNQIIEACNEVIKSTIVNEINSAGCFTVLADETTDISSIEQLAICVRYVKKIDSTYKICEHFLQFVPVESTTGDALSTAIINCLISSGINMSFLRGQGYDGAANMSGALKGVRARISDLYPSAIYVHCVAHCLNLVISSASEVQAIRNCVGVVEKVYDFFNTPKRQVVLQKNITNLLPTAQNEKLKQMSPTRWVQRHDAVMIMVKLFHSIVVSLEEISQWTEKDASSGASILKTSIGSSEFLISLMCLEKLLGYTLPLSKLLQNSSIDLAIAVDHANEVINLLKNLRDNASQEFETIFNSASAKAALVGNEIKRPRVANKQIHRNNILVDNCLKYYEITIFLPFLDSMLSEMMERFSKHKDILTNFNSLLPQRVKPTDERIKQFHCLSQFYKNDVEDHATNLEAEFKLWHEKFLDKSNKCIIPKNAIDALNLCNPDIYPNIFILLKIFATLPVSTATGERTFSTLRRLKTYLRNSMGENRLSGLANLHIQRQIKIDPFQILDILARNRPRKLDFLL